MYSCCLRLLLDVQQDFQYFVGRNQKAFKNENKIRSVENFHISWHSMLIQVLPDQAV